ncbi:MULTISPECIES: hypothetical protein [Pseudomonas]|uniref:hypothetical protein n=1 Tax=Pseudomonas TaxID=286 RepID=UPI00146FFA6E|nr:MULTISPECIES: hypothetical protein [Pseudomonas]KAF4559218.1 hypothetical protein HBJ16_003220 [Pseudomonas sp. CES]MBF8786643.1 hypothetical protein [Pseudomonas asiatica]
MDTSKMRDTYEAWAIQDAASVGRDLVIDREGDWYIGKDAQFLNLGWASWQASREAVVVELPELRSVPDRDCWSRTNGLGFNNALKEARQVIEAQGLKVEVKP